MTEAKPKDYWISPTALRITLNALSDADYIQATAASGAMVLCYMKGIDGLGYDNGHNYKRWPLKISQTYFTTTSKKYVYIRIPRAGNNETDTAMVVFPSQHLDLYGMTEGGLQVGDAGYYYIFTQGIISASEPSDEGLRRHWEQNLNTGTLDSDEALDSGGTGEWWEYNPITDMVTFLKKIAHGEFEELLADYLEAEQTVTDLVVSRNFLSGPDGEGFRLIRNAGNDVSELEVDRATIREKMYANWLQSSDYTGEGMLDSGFRLWYENGRSKLVIDDIVARGKFSVYELESRIMTHAGGDVCFSGAGSKLFYVEYLNDAGESLGYTTINSPWMLRDKFLLAGASGLAAWANRRKIQRQLTQAEKASVTKFRCYVFSDDGTMKTRNWWRVHDLARCQTFDHTQMKQTAEGYYSGDNVSNTVYWRRVAGIGSKRIEALGDNKIYDYFDLWNVADVSQRTWFDPSVGEHGAEVLIGADMQIPDPEHEGEMIDYTTPGFDQNGWDDWPAAGDDVVQFGNARDVDRMAVNVLQVTGGEPGLKVYHGIHDYRTDKCKWVDIGYDAGLQRAKADVFGDFYFGARGSVDPRDGSTYVRYNAASKLLEIKARISVQSTYGDSDKSLYDYVRDNIWTPSEIEGMIGDGVEIVQNQLDGNFTIYYGQGEPTNSNYPAEDWNTTQKKKEHVYDLYWDRTNKNGYRWVKTVNQDVVTYGWDQIGDSSILAALAAAADAQDTADGKRRVFLNTPVPPYDQGDLWAQGANGDIMRCVMAKTKNQQYAETDWSKASKYTDDSALTDFINGAYKTFRENIESQIDKKAETWYQSSDPASSWTTNAAKAKHVGDIWMDTSANGGKKTYIYQDKGENASPRYKWEAQNVPDSVFDKIDGKANIYVTWNAWGDELHVRDLYIPSANKTAGGVTYYKDKVYRCTNATTPTFEEIGYTDDSALSNFIANRYANDLINLNSSISTAQGTANSAATVAGNAQAAANALAYVKSALGATTDIDGGLMLTTLIALRNKNADNSYTTWGGINGAYQNGNTIAAWFGGGMVDHEKNPTASNYAKILFRMNGSGYMAGGKFSWDDSGNATIGGFDIGTDQLGAIDYDFDEGWAFIKRDGFFSVNKLNSARTYSAEIYGGAAIYAGVGVAGTDNDNYIKVSSNGVYIHGNVYINTGSTLKAYYHSDELGTGGGGGSSSSAWADITGKPSTISGYGIKDCKISGSTITIGSSSITPLTSHQSLTNYATKQYVSDNYLTPDQLANYGYATTNWVDTNYLSRGGGTVKGHLHLKFDNSNYGCYLIFGDRPGSGQDYAYLGENSDDHMVLYGKRGVLVQAGGTGGSNGRLILESLVQSTSDTAYTGIDINCVDGILNIKSDGNNQGCVEIGTSHGTSIYTRNETAVIVANDWSSNGSSFTHAVGNISILTKGTNGNITIKPASGSTEVWNFVNKSDIRNKNILEYKDYSVEEFARAPLFSFTWKDSEDKREHIGTSAQYWQPLIPETVSTIKDYDKDGRTIIGEHLSLDYITLSYIGVITLAREVTRLQEEVNKLKQSINN